MIKDLKRKLFISAIILIFASVLYIFEIPCIFLSITGVHCIGCGMTRALLNAIKLDFAAAFSHHIMFFSIPFLYAAFLLDGKLFKSKTANIIFYFLIGLGFLANWILGFVF
ncbi:MAG: DUF2752 domain-containing protein [Clostridia bacterium]|nr:DUF2752 domain-containing protein [Clostridia bacterium]